MLKRIFLAILLLFTSYVPAHSAEIVNVEYVHSLIKKVWDIDVPYYEDSLKYAANMEYVLKAVDKANEILNGTPTTDYGNSEYATLYAADTVATIDAVNRLIEKQNKSSFYITTTPDTSSFDIMISAAGEYTIDWGDGKTDTITKTDTTMTPYSHTYDKAGEYTIGLGGKATDYNDAEIDITQEGSEELMMMSAAISFAGNTNIANISGSLGEIFSTLPDGSQPRFAATFMMTSITSIPENLFSGVQGAPKDFMFAMTFVGTPITSIPENLFSGIQGAPANGMFYGTFGMTPITSIPDGLFDGISGAPAEMMFAVTFTGCTNLSGEIPLGLFGELSGAPAEMMFMMTFSECSGLTGPSARQPDGTYLYDYFDTATITQVGDMYTGATGLEDYPCIPELWGGMGGYCGTSAFYIQTTPDTSSFDIMISAAGEYTIDWGDGKTDTITKTDTTMTPYSHTYDKAGEYTIGLGGKATDYNDVEIDITQEGSEELMMMSAAISFGGNTNIAEISGSLGEIFSTLPDGRQPMFSMTFMMTPITSIPAGLFSGIQGAPKDFMFAMTFVGTPITSIPAGLFADIQGVPANGMFYGTFGMTPITSIPDGLFDGISGAPAEMMFAATFTGCANLSGEIPLGLFGELSGAPAEMMFMMTFSGCSGLTGPSARQPDGTYLYDYFDNATVTQVGDMYTGATGLEDYPCIPELWGGAGGVCGGSTDPIDPVESSFYITTTPDTSSFSFQISAAGEYTIDWGDGEIETITKSDTTMTPYSHTYDKAGQYFIGLDGKATDYSELETEENQSIDFMELMMSAAISFAENTNIAKISGSLGEIFSTLPDGRQPRFAATFMETSLVSIPENLFSGVQGAPASYMFYSTFDGCSGLTGEIPAGLFAGIQGAPAERMFQSTFDGCSGLTGIPADLFAGIQGAPASYMFNATFYGCSGLTSIPADLFAGITGAPANSMFAYTFFGCSGLTGEIPLGLFGTFTSNTPQGNMFRNTFNWCSKLTGPSARQPDGTYLYDYFNTASSDEAGGMYTGATGLEDYPCIPTAWGGAGGVCTPPFESSFYITTTPYTSSFSFRISAAGEYTIDWGDGNIERITKTDTTMTPYSHTYDKAGEYTIGLSGQATAYSSSTSTAAVSFSYNTNIAEISGSLGKVFSTLSDGTQPRFYQTFNGCTNLTGSIPADLFAGIKGAPAERMFSGTFSECSGLTGEIPADLFAGISGAPASNMFAYTFYGCTNLTGSIPENLFAGITGAPAEYMFQGTFNGCSGLTSIPEDLFAGIQGAPAEMMFMMTFSGCSGLTGKIPEGLFAGIQGAPADNMFGYTFYECSNLSGEIPADLFAGITGAPAMYMFQNTFNGCSGLTGEIPAGLFGELSGAPASSMFAYTFDGCSGLTGEIPLGLFGTFTSNTPHSYMFQNTFNGCSGLTGPSARQPDGTYLYDYFNTASSDEAGGMYTGATGLEDYPCIPTAWGGAGGVCTPPFESSFYITTTPTTSSFSFQISAAGEYTIDWGDGKTETITKTNTTNTTYSHTYDSAGEYTIGIGGKATAYSSDVYTAAVSFSYNTNIAEISGSLGKVFSTLSDGTQPRFYSTFEGCSGLTGEIPADLFSGIQGAPAERMFSGTFSECSGLTGEIPADLFAGIQGAPAERMFQSTFDGCSGLTGEIPADLFAGISGAPASNMFAYTFYGCSNLSGEIPAGLFGELSGAPAEGMFNYTFYGCSGLTGSIPAGLFAGIQGAPVTGMFYGTFSRCSGLTGSIPADLFTGIQGAPASSMFSSTFSGCSGLTGEIPADLFAGITGAPASGMFSGTFYKCSGLTGEIPADLFAGITGAPASGMFSGTFSGCSGLTGEIPLGLFGTFTSKTPQYDMFQDTFNGCSGLTGPSARMPDGTYLYDYFNTAKTIHVDNMYYGATGLSDYASIPAAWK